MNDAKLTLVVVAHPDDEILGFGAAGAKLAAAGEVVQPVILCGGVDARTRRPSDEALFHDLTEANKCVGFAQPVLGEFPNIRMNAVPHLELVQFVEGKVLEFQPHRIVTHHPADLNDDHGRVARAAMVAARLFQRNAEVRPLEALLLMEIQSSTDWSFGGVEKAGFRPDTFIEVGDFLDLKLRALNCYRGVMRDFPHPRSEKALRGLAALRGAQCGLGEAEAFQSLFRTSLG